MHASVLDETGKPLKLVLKTVAMPADANAYGDIFGGWLVSQMDLGGANLAHQCARSGRDVHFCGFR